MEQREIKFGIIILFLVSVFFFYKTFLQGLLPFPGDLLLSEYNPWKTYSYDGYNPGAIPNKAQYFDVIRQIYPWKTIVIDSLKHGVVPFWNPYNFSGSPLLANIQSAVFYPLAVMYFFLPQPFAWTVLVILQPLLTSFFTYLFARKIGIGKIGALLSAIIFAYSLYMSVFLEYNTIGHVIIWLPLALYAFESNLRKNNLWMTLLYTGCIAIFFFAGHLQIATLCVGFILLYAIGRVSIDDTIKKKKLFLLHHLILLVFAIGFAAIQLFPTFELIQNSARVPHDIQVLLKQFLLQPHQLSMFFVPDIFGNPAVRNYVLDASYPTKAVYIGIIPLLFALLSAGDYRRNKYIKLLAFLAAFFFIMLFRSPITQFVYSLPIPFLSSSSPSNGIFLLSFVLALLAGFGMERWLKEKGISLRMGIIFLTIFFICLGVSIFFGPEVNKKNILYSIGILLLGGFLLLISHFFKRKEMVSYGILLITIFDLFYFFQKFNPFVPKEYIYPDTAVFSWLKEHAKTERIWSYGSGFIESNFETQYKLFSPNGYDPLYPARYGVFISASKDGKLVEMFDGKTRSNAILSEERSLEENKQRNRMLNLLGVRYVVDRSENNFPSNQFSLVYKKDGWRILQNRVALPRAALISKNAVTTTNEDFERLFFSDSYDPKQTVISEENIPSGKMKRGEVRMTNYAENETHYQVSADDSTILFISDTYFPGWRAFIDGRETKIYRAGYAFRAVHIPQGIHDVAFYYKPRSFTFGIYVASVSIIFLLGYCLFWQKKTYV